MPTNFREMSRDSVLPIYNQAKKQCCVVASSPNLHSGGVRSDCRPGVLHIRGAFKFYGLLIFFSGMEADRNVKVVGGDVVVL